MVFAMLPRRLASDWPLACRIVLPTAIVILGGLVTSTLLTLFVVPSLCLRFGRPAEAAA
jgi:Cu/Ag efflux pump CusA